MSIVAYNPTGVSAMEQLQTAEAFRAPAPPLTPPPAPQSDIDKLALPGVVKNTLRSLRTDSLVGATLTDAIPYAVHRYMAGSEVDPSWDVRSLATDEYLSQHPWMMPYFENGVADEFPNRARFDVFAERQQQDYLNRQIMGEQGWAAGMLYGLPAITLDSIATLGLGEAVGAGRLIGSAGRAINSGTTAARAAKGAVAGATLNLAQEQSVRLANPYRNVPENEAAAWAVGMGLAFGSMLPVIGAGTKSAAGRIGEAVSERRLRRAQKQTAEAMAAPELAGLEHAGAAEAEALKGVAEELDQTLQAKAKITPPEPTDLVGSARSVQTRADIEARLVEMHKASPESSAAADMMDGYTQDGMGSSYDWSGVFYKKLPPEIEQLARENPEIRPYLSVTDSDPGRARGWDTFSADETRWLTYIKEVAGGELRRAKEWAYTSQDPAARFMAALHDKLPERGDKTPKIAVNPSDLPPGTTFRIHGEQFEVVPDADGFGATLRDGGDYPEVPSWAMDQLAVDKGSVRLNTGDIRAMGAADPTIGEGIDAAGNDTRRVFTILDTPETRPQIDALKAKYGDQVEFLRHPQQDHYDRLQLLKELEKTLADTQPADFGKVKNAVAKVLDANTLVPVNALKAPGPVVMRSPVATSRRLARALMDFAWPTQESADSPLTHAPVPPAEALKWQHEARAHRAVLDFHAAYKEAGRTPTPYQMGDGSTILIRKGRERDFSRAVWDFMVRENNRARGGEAFDHPPALKKAADALNEFYRYMGAEARDAGVLKGLREDAYHVPRRWLSDVIRLNHDEFVRTLIGQWETNRRVEFSGGGRINPDERPIIDSLLEHAGGKNSALSVDDVAAVRDLASQLRELDPNAALTEGMLRKKLGDDLYARYLEEVAVYHRAAAESVFETLTSIEHTHGVEDAIPSFARERKLEIDETAFSKFIDRDARNLAETYQRQMAGRTAVRQAMAAHDLAPLVKELTGKDLAESGYDPSLVIEAVKRDYQRWLDATVGDAKAQAALEKALRTDIDIFNTQVARLEGRPVFDNNPAANAGWKLWLERQTLRLPMMAQLGKMAISSWNDAAAMQQYKALTSERLSQIGAMLNIFREIKPTRDVEALYVSLAEMTRSIRAMELSDVADLPDHRSFGPGRAGAALQITDQAVQKATDTFATLTGINRWNRAGKNFLAHKVTQTVIDGARRMAKAMELMDAGQSEQAALRNAGLSIEDAQRLNRLGFNGERSRRLMEILDEHGVDFEGNKVTSDHKGYISPEYHAWAAKDRSLRDVMMAGINAEVMNILLEPKLGSRPLSGNTWFGRAFNQFQSFAYAWGNQQLPMTMQRPGYEIAQYAALMTGLGALTDAVHNQLSGRRNIDDTLALWADKPFGMVYAAVNRAGLFGWLARPLGLLEQTPIGPAKLLGNNAVSTMYARPMTLTGQLGPFFNWADNLTSGTTSYLFKGDWSDKTKRQLWNALPYHNLWQIEGINRLWEHSGGNSLLGPNARYQPERL